MSLYKLHGSLNWVYCPRCVQIHYAGTEKLAHRLANDFLFCENCRQKLVPVLIPPTFIKEVSNPYLHQVWLAADTKLKTAQRIIFCGYSFPDADVQVRHLLKRIQINHRKNPSNFKVDVVNGKRRESETEENWIKRKYLEKMHFETFFGKDLVEYHEMDFETFAKSPF